MVLRCGASSPATLCLARVFLEACFPWLCFLLRCPWPLGAGIAAADTTLKTDERESALLRAGRNWDFIGFLQV
jgi:hypothetical protein